MPTLSDPPPEGLPFVDIADDDAPVVAVDRKTDARIQSWMLRVHGTLVHAPTELDAARSWVARGWARRYRAHYRIV